MRKIQAPNHDAAVLLVSGSPDDHSGIDLDAADETHHGTDGVDELGAGVKITGNHRGSLVDTAEAVTCGVCTYARCKCHDKKHGELEATASDEFTDSLVEILDSHFHVFVSVFEAWTAPTAPRTGAATLRVDKLGLGILPFRTWNLVESQRDMDSVNGGIILRTHRDRNHRNSIC